MSFVTVCRLENSFCRIATYGQEIFDMIERQYYIS